MCDIVTSVKGTIIIISKIYMCDIVMYYSIKDNYHMFGKSCAHTHTHTVIK